ncbi:hypothetical protein B0H19DRAFT_1067554 [Mycena capillaripes]|nr:hypothetical protein B0H19DRAFT_1067554 [Mycena capillaripes]
MPDVPHSCCWTSGEIDHRFELRLFSRPSTSMLDARRAAVRPCTRYACLYGSSVGSYLTKLSISRALACVRPTRRMHTCSSRLQGLTADSRRLEKLLDLVSVHLTPTRCETTPTRQDRRFNAATTDPTPRPPNRRRRNTMRQDRRLNAATIDPTPRPPTRRRHATTRQDRHNATRPLTRPLARPPMCDDAKRT